ncbi:MAG: SOS response-associated peptidase [Desulfatirhabdiaceae bacterium]
MCGRFVAYRKLEELHQYSPIDHAKCVVEASYNIDPTQEILVITQQDGKNILDRFHWGLVPGWAKDKAIGNSLINARSETKSSKPSFRSAFKRRRCQIPADGFYEWKAVPETGKKQPYFFTLPNENPFAFAGLWEVWTDESETGYRSCSIITTDASESVKPIHHRMPVILNPDYFEPWLNGMTRDVEAIQKIFQDGIISGLSCRPVSLRVNSVHNNGPENIRYFTLP